VVRSTHPKTDVGGGIIALTRAALSAARRAGLAGQMRGVAHRQPPVSEDDRFRALHSYLNAGLPGSFWWTTPAFLRERLLWITAAFPRQLWISRVATARSLWRSVNFAASTRETRPARPSPGWTTSYIAR
jgi:hypothetical protein